ATAATLAATGPARAQQLDNYIPSSLAGYDVMPGVTVTSRLRPEYDPLTIRFGDWTIRPEASQSIGYDDNVLGTAQKQGSLALGTRASLQGAYAPPGSNLELGVDVSHFGYPDLTAQSYTNWSAGAGWSYELDRENTIGLGFRHFELNQIPAG